MSFVITDQDTINAIQDAYNAQNLPLAYTLVFDAISNVTTAVVDGVPVITTSPAAGVDAGVWAWVGGAINVNTNSGAFAQYIRDYTAEQYSLRTGSTLDPTRIQTASNDIARRFIADMFGELSDPQADPGFLENVYSSLTLPDLRRIGLIDAGAAAAEVFPGKNYSPWAGTVLFTQLGEESFFKDWVLTTDVNDKKKEPGTYDLATIAKTTVDLLTTGFEISAVLRGELGTALNILALGAQAVADATAQANSFFSQTYGVSSSLINIGHDIFSANRFSISANYVVGTTADDAAIQTVDGTEFVNGGRGADTINGSFDALAAFRSSGVIDGGDDNDTMDYSNLSKKLNVTFENVGTLGVRATIEKDPDGADHTDFVYEVENFKLGQGADTVKISAGADLSTIRSIDAGTQPENGKDILDLSEFDGDLSVDDGKLTGTDISIQLDNFEEIIGLNSSDMLDLDGTSVTKVDGGSGDDIIVGGDSYAILLGGDGDDQLTAGSGGATLDGGIGNNTYTGGAAADIFVIGNGADAMNGSSADFVISNAGANDRLVLRLDDAVGFADAENWTKGIVLNGGVRAVGKGVDPDEVGADFSSILVSPKTFGTNSDGAWVTETSLDVVRSELGFFEVSYGWDQPNSQLFVSIASAYGNFNVRVDGFQNGQLGLNFVNVSEPKLDAFHGDEKSITEIQDSWTAYHEALQSFVDNTQIVNLPSPGTPVDGNSSAVTPFADIFWLPGSSSDDAMMATTAAVPGVPNLDSQMTQLVQAMATHPAPMTGFDSASASLSILANDNAPQNPLIAVGHS
jgi:Ca2+-binding RTX toxin-like protein